MALLFGLAAVSIPILIHLFNRRSAKAVDWGAMQFLLQSLVTRRRRVLIEEILLLVVRCLLLGLLALAMARPFAPEGSPVPWIVVLPVGLLGLALMGASFALWRYRRWQLRVAIAGVVLLHVAGLAVGLEEWLNLKRFGGRGRKDVALLLDGSTSMTMAAEGRTNFERAVAEAEQLIRRGNRKSAFSILVAGSAAQAVIPAPLSDRKELLAALDTVKPVFGTLHAPDALLAGAMTLAQGYNPTKQIVVITDGQRAGWETDRPARWELLNRAFQNLPVPPQVVVRTFDLPAHYRNLALDDIRLSRKVVGNDREVSVNVRVENTGTEAVTPSRIELTVGEKTFENRAVTQLRPGTSETVTFSHRFPKPGTVVLSARVIVDDDLPSDNAAVRAVNVIDHLRVLIVDGNPTGRFMERAGAFPALALAPSPATAAEDGPGKPVRQANLLVDPVLVQAARLAGVENLDGYHVIVLADVPRLPAATAERLARYVVAGGGLLVAPGSRALPPFYDEWTVEGHGPVLPARLQEWVRIPDAAQPLQLSSTTFRHDALRIVAGGNRSDIAACRVSACWTLAPHELTGIVEVGGRLSNGEPFLAERALGRGLVLMTAISLDTRGSNLATLQSFVPFLHEAVYHLANPSAPHLHLEAGRDIAIRLPIRPDAPPRKGAGRQTGSTGPRECTAVDPDGAARAATIEAGKDALMARIEGAVVPGLYRLFVPETEVKRLAWLTAEDGSIPITINREVGESELKALSDTDFAMLKQRGEFVEAESIDDVESVLAGRAFGEELWRPLAIAALALVILEILLTRWITLRRKTGREQAVDFESQMAPSAAFREQLTALRSSSRGT